MKISPKLLHAILFAATVATTTACESRNTTPEAGTEPTTRLEQSSDSFANETVSPVPTTVDPDTAEGASPIHDFGNCPACGMG